jgi:hypothetical protein
MPYLFFMVLPTMMWDLVMNAAAHDPARTASSRATSGGALAEPASETASEPWGRLTP